MNKCFNGLYAVHLELTSRCDKKCWMCGRRKLEKEYPDKLQFGDMPIELVVKISRQLPKDIVVQFHNNGEPLLYSQLGTALKLFKKQIRCMDTNAKLLIRKAPELIGNLDTLTISVIENDTEGDEQYNIVKQFLKIKQDRKPRMIYRLLGEVKDAGRWHKLPGLVATRILHNPLGSFQYTKKATIPEIGICIEALTHMAISREGDVSMCVRFDPEKKGVMGSLYKRPLWKIWNGETRQKWLKKHINGMRDSSMPLCKKCEYWGIPHE